MTRHNVQQLLRSTGAKEVHVGSDCHESVPTTVPHGSTVSSEFSGKGVYMGAFKRLRSVLIGPVEASVINRVREAWV